MITVEEIKWGENQFKYIKNFSEKEKLILKIYSETYFFKIINNFCNQIIDPKTILEYNFEEPLVNKYIEINNLNIPGNIRNKNYFIFVIDLIIMFINDLINIINNSPPTPELKVYRGTKNYYYSKDNNILINYGFASTSNKQKIAYTFTGKKCCLFNVTIPKGTKCIYLSLLQLIDQNMKYDESEIVLSPYSSFKLEDINKYSKYSDIDEYNITYQESNNIYYNQFNVYKKLLLSIYFNNDSNDIKEILINNPININPFLLKLLYEKNLFNNEICDIILEKKIKIESDYILYSINSKVDNSYIIKLIDTFKELVLSKNLINIVNVSMNNDNLEIIRYLNLYYTDYMDKYINKSIKYKIKNWFNKFKFFN